MTHPLLTDEFIHWHLEQAREHLKQGDKGVILHTMHWCQSWGIPNPGWLRDAFAEAYLKGSRLEIGSWDEVFGPVKKGKWQVAAKKRREKMGLVYVLVQHLNASDPKKYPLTRTVKGKAVGAFAEAGKRLGLTPRDAETCYYAMGPAANKVATYLGMGAKPGSSAVKSPFKGGRDLDRSKEEKT
jgi:hypothetical protein